MLKDRKLLISYELTKLHNEAAQIYFNIVTQDGDTHNTEYQKLKDRINDLEHDYKMVSLLINQGHQ